MLFKMCRNITKKRLWETIYTIILPKQVLYILPKRCIGTVPLCYFPNIFRKIILLKTDISFDLFYLN